MNYNSNSFELVNLSSKNNSFLFLIITILIILILGLLFLLLIKIKSIKKVENSITTLDLINGEYIKAEKYNIFFNNTFKAIEELSINIKNQDNSPYKSMN